MSVDEAQADTPQEWYCDQCGRRYPGPGECAEEHPANELKPVGAPEAAPEEIAVVEETAGTVGPGEHDAAGAGGDEPAPAAPLLEQAQTAIHGAIDALQGAASALAAHIVSHVEE